jgi:hypothetical protein
VEKYKDEGKTMPLPMIHLAVGQKLENKLKIYSVSNFYVGTIAPDSIHMRENTTPDDKKTTHLSCCKESIDALKENIKQFYNSEVAADNRNENLSFITGYCAHILTDFYWSKTIYQDFKKNVPDGLDKKKIAELYYSDTDLIDSKIFHWSDWVNTVFKALSKSGSNRNELLREVEITKWQERILGWYPDKRFDPSGSTTYIEYDSIDGFIKEATEYVFEIFNELALSWN